MGCSESRIEGKNFTQTLTSEMDESKDPFEKSQFDVFDSILLDDTAILIKLLSQGISVDYRMSNFYYRTPLHIACQSGSTKTIKLLIEKGADIHIEDSYGITPIFLAQLKDKKLYLEILKQVENKKSSGYASNRKSTERRVSVV